MLSFVRCIMSVSRGMHRHQDRLLNVNLLLLRLWKVRRLVESIVLLLLLRLLLRLELLLLRLVPVVVAHELRWVLTLLGRDLHLLQLLLMLLWLLVEGLSLICILLLLLLLGLSRVSLLYVDRLLLNNLRWLIDRLNHIYNLLLRFQ